jgi:hypothetical protein
MEATRGAGSGRAEQHQKYRNGAVGAATAVAAAATGGGEQLQHEHAFHSACLWRPGWARVREGERDSERVPCRRKAAAVSVD